MTATLSENWKLDERENGEQDEKKLSYAILNHLNTIYSFLQLRYFTNRL